MAIATDLVWYRHERDCWALGEVKQLQGERVLLSDRGSGGAVTVKVLDTYPCHPSHLEDLKDIAHMNNMHEAPLLNLLKRRYADDDIYTFTGEILISINPYQVLPGLYNIPELDEGAGARGSAVGRRGARRRVPRSAAARPPNAAPPPSRSRPASTPQRRTTTATTRSRTCLP
jgi:myosin-5